MSHNHNNTKSSASSSSSSSAMPQSNHHHTHNNSHSHSINNNHHHQKSTSSENSVNSLIGGIGEIEAQRRVLMMQLKETELRGDHLEKDLISKRKELERSKEQETELKHSLQFAESELGYLNRQVMLASENVSKVKNEEPVLLTHVNDNLKGVETVLHEWDGHLSAIDVVQQQWYDKGKSTVQNLQSKIDSASAKLSSLQAKEVAILTAASRFVAQRQREEALRKTNNNSGGGVGGGGSSSSSSFSAFNSINSRTRGGGGNSDSSATGGGVQQEITRLAELIATQKAALEMLERTNQREVTNMNREIEDLTSRNEEIHSWNKQVLSNIQETNVAVQYLQQAQVTGLCPTCQQQQHDHQSSCQQHQQDSFHNQEQQQSGPSSDGGDGIAQSSSYASSALPTGDSQDGETGATLMKQQQHQQEAKQE